VPLEINAVVLGTSGLLIDSLEGRMNSVVIRTLVHRTTEVDLLWGAMPRKRSEACHEVMG